jgi:hypothetical protein
MQRQKLTGIFALCVLFLLGNCFSVTAQNRAEDFAVRLTATIASAPAEIRLHWVPDSNAKSYTVSRKLLEGPTWNLVATLGGEANEYADQNIQANTGYEYQVIKNTNLGYTGYGYIYSGLQLPVRDYRGRILLVIEQSMAAALPEELERLEYDLIGDGWTVERIMVSAQDAVAQVKNNIRQKYNQDPGNTKAALLIGHVPVPYSGDISPDEHPNHQGAWPADVYYGDLDGSWTDGTVTSTNAERRTNWNVPGDGKFDQSLIPSQVELEIGRVDLSNMTCFLNKSPSRNEVDLMKRYLFKNHQFRHGVFNIPEQSLIMDLIGMRAPEPMSAMSWRNGPPLTGDKVFTESNNLFPLASNSSFLFGFLCGGGAYTFSATMGTSDVLAFNDLNIVFVGCIGSYFGDWDNESNLLRALLGANGTCLAASYAAKPAWLYHPMAMGEPIGMALKLTQENREGGLYPPYNLGTAMVHISLLGDPTLRAHPVAPVKNIQSITQAQNLTLSWERSSAPNLMGYLVYKSNQKKGPYQRITSSIIQDNSFSDSAHLNGDYYMVKAVNSTHSPSGSYMNTSQGIFFPDIQSIGQEIPPQPPQKLSLVRATPTEVNLQWIPSASPINGYRIERKSLSEPAFQEIALVPSTDTSFTDKNIPAPGIYLYRMRAWNNGGYSVYTEETPVTTTAATVEFLGYDFQTSGNWENNYGKEGYAFAKRISSLPTWTTLSISNLTDYGGNYTVDPRVPLAPGWPYKVDRIWSAHGRGDIDVMFSDGQAHEVSLYSFETEQAPRRFDLEVVDALTGGIFDKRVLNDYTNGVYISYLVKGHVLFRLNPAYLENMMIFGFYIDPPKLRTLAVNPNGGYFLGSKEVSISSPTAGVEIHYTLDGTVPTRGSPIYQGPLTLRSTSILKARGFRDGFEDSPVATAIFSNLLNSQIGFLKLDESTSGSWQDKYGSQGYVLPPSIFAQAAYSQLQPQGADTWTWSDSTDFTQALSQGPGRQGRIASCWYAGDSFSIDLSVLDSTSHSVAFYFLDWDRKGRVERVEFLNDSGTVVQSFDIANFEQGKYLVMNVQGYTKVKISRLQGNNAVLNGMFFDASPAPLGSPPTSVPIAIPRIQNGLFKFEMPGQTGTIFTVDSSTNLRDWSPIQTNILINGTQFPVTIAPTTSKQFFRIHLLP